jgi:hypothetical protein
LVPRRSFSFNDGRPKGQVSVGVPGGDVTVSAFREAIAIAGLQNEESSAKTLPLASERLHLLGRGFDRPDLEARVHHGAQEIREIG